MSFGKKRGKSFGFGGFALSSSFHKAGQLSSFQETRERGTWDGKKTKAEDE